MELSGYGEVLVWESTTAENVNGTTVDYTMTGTEVDGLNILLWIVLGVCILIFLLLSCIFAYLCTFLRKRKFRYDTCTKLVSKTTSVTGLNDTGASVESCRKFETTVRLTGNLGANVKNDSFTNDQITKTTSVTVKPVFRKPVEKDFVTSTPVSACETVPVNVSPNLFQTADTENTIYHSAIEEVCSSARITAETCKQVHDCGDNNEVQHSSDFSSTEKFLTVDNLPNIDSCFLEGSSAREEQEPDVSTSSSLLLSKATGTPHILDPYICAEHLGNDAENILNASLERKQLLPMFDMDDADSYQISSTEISPVTPNGLTSSLPMDVYGHPRAWFVPLDEIYHEPLRHSYINVSNHESLQAFATTEDKNNKLKGSSNLENSITQSDLDSKNDYVTSTNSNSSDSDMFGENKTENKKDWRDSGIPNSHSNLRRCNSSDLDSKKPSLWEQREDRPVVFLETASGAPASPI